MNAKGAREERIKKERVEMRNGKTKKGSGWGRQRWEDGGEGGEGEVWR